MNVPREEDAQQQPARSIDPSVMHPTYTRSVNRSISQSCTREMSGSPQDVLWLVKQNHVPDCRSYRSQCGTRVFRYGGVIKMSIDVSNGERRAISIPRSVNRSVSHQQPKWVVTASCASAWGQTGFRNDASWAQGWME